MTASPASAVLAQAAPAGNGLVNILQNLFSTAVGLIVMAIIVVGLVFVVMTWMRTRSLVPTLGALLLGALVTWGANNFTGFSQRIGEDVGQFDTPGSGVEPNVGNDLSDRP